MRASAYILPVLFAALSLAACDQGSSAPPEPQARAPTPNRTPAPLTPPPTFTPPAPRTPEPERASPPPAPPPPQAASTRTGRLPLTRILAIARQRVAGEVIDVELDEDDDDDTAVYKLEILTPEGRAIEMELDARTGAVLEIEED